MFVFEMGIRMYALGKINKFIFVISWFHVWIIFPCLFSFQNLIMNSEIFYRLSYVSFILVQSLWLHRHHWIHSRSCVGQRQRTSRTELQQRSSKILEEHSVKTILQVVNLYQLSTTLGLEPVSIIKYTKPGSSIKRPTTN